ncbi:MAG: 2-dehydropantoate 2-reductase [Lachnospiraceae bacterium]|nr:2-dehydropantoate 2-reductase [Lachnospiraceae bacterium]
MEYLIIGAGGTGGCIGAYMTEAGKDVTMIARGAHLHAMQKDGLRMETTKKGNYTVCPVKAADMEHYEGHPDVIFVCVKGYSLEETVPLIRRAAKPETVVIPLLNIYGTGGRLQKLLPKLLVTDGCIYIAGEIKEPGCLWQNGDIFRVVFGVRDPSEYREILQEVKNDLEDSGITGVLSDHIRRDALQKFAYVSPAAACGQYYDAMAGDMQKPGEIRDTFAALIHEIDLLADAMGICFTSDIVQTNLDILDSLTPEASTSMQRDIKQGKASEMDGLIFEVVRMGQQYKIKLPVYEKITEELKRRGFS